MTRPMYTRTRGNGTYQFTMETQNVMKSVSLKDAFKAGVISGVSPVRENENEYLFVTVVNRAGQALNVYFGKKSAEHVELDDILTPEQMLGANIILANNKTDGGERIKISLDGESDYTNLADIFGDVEVTNDHATEVLDALRASMKTRKESEAEADDEDDTAEEDVKALADAKAIRDAKKLAKLAKAGKE